DPPVLRSPKARGFFLRIKKIRDLLGNERRVRISPPSAWRGVWSLLLFLGP
uniref:Uncharacterized protein n=1 Tax=Aegilops tauschii subsp. strangulata TaxID=200361 RepID=A0A453J734_AEGTS